jgi:multiple sugar transport system ATP-binding protein
MAEIILKNLVKKFGDFTAVKNLNLTIRDKEFLVLLGPSGCGKTTTLRSISGLEIPTEGQILLDGEDVTKKRASQRDIAFVFQLYALYPHFTTYGNIAFPLKTQKVDKATIDAEVRKIAELLQITHILSKKPKELAGGDMQRVALGRALVRKPKAFLLDEPIGTLDAQFREEMRTELKRLHVDVGATTVYVTHDQIEAMAMGDRIAIMNAGVLQQVGEPYEIYSNPINLFVANFIGSPGMNFLDCRMIKEQNEHIALKMDTDGTIISLPGELQHRFTVQEENKELVLGVRPEDVILCKKNTKDALKVEVFVIENMGAHHIVDVKYGEEAIRVRTLPTVRPNIREQLFICFDMERIRLFDKHTEDSIMVSPFSKRFNP